MANSRRVFNDDSSDRPGPGLVGTDGREALRPVPRGTHRCRLRRLIFDYRGFGESEGDRNRLSPRDQLEDLVNAVTYLTTRQDVETDAIGAFGSGGTGGGNVILPRRRIDAYVRSSASCLLPMARTGCTACARNTNGSLSSRRLTKTGVNGFYGHGWMVDPRRDHGSHTRAASTTVKSDVDDRVPTSVPLAAAEEILAYRPLDAASSLKVPLLVIGVEGDATTPTDHAVRLFEAATGPRELIMQRHTTHYAAYDQYWKVVTPRLRLVRPIPASERSRITRPMRRDLGEGRPMIDLRIRGGTVWSGEGPVHADVLIEGGMIASRRARRLREAETEVEATARQYFPG